MGDRRPRRRYLATGRDARHGGHLRDAGARLVSALPAEFDRFFPVMPQRSNTAGVELRGVHAAVRRHVRFEQFNLMSATPPQTGFDIVLCRNVLIYLTVPARAKALSALQLGLRPGGYLMLGPTDALADGTRYDA